MRLRLARDFWICCTTSRYWRLVWKQSYHFNDQSDKASKTDVQKKFVINDFSACVNWFQLKLSKFRQTTELMIFSKFQVDRVTTTLFTAEEARCQKLTCKKTFLINDFSACVNWFQLKLSNLLQTTDIMIPSKFQLDRRTITYILSWICNLPNLPEKRDGFLFSLKRSEITHAVKIGAWFLDMLYNFVILTTCV